MTDPKLVTCQNVQDQILKLLQAHGDMPVSHLQAVLAQQAAQEITSCTQKILQTLLTDGTIELRPNLGVNLTEQA